MHVYFHLLLPAVRQRKKKMTVEKKSPNPKIVNGHRSSHRKKFHLEGLAQIIDVWIPFGWRWHTTGADASLEAAGCGDGRDSTGGAFLEPRSRRRGHRGSPQVLGNTRCRGRHVSILLNMRHASDRRGLARMVAERRPGSPTFGGRVR